MSTRSEAGLERRRGPWGKESVIDQLKITEDDYEEFRELVKAKIHKAKFYPATLAAAKAKRELRCIIDNLLPRLPASLKDIEPLELRTEVLWDLARAVVVYVRRPNYQRQRSGLYPSPVEHDSPAREPRERHIERLAEPKKNYFGCQLL
jgi:hypothetical protein